MILCGIVAMVWDSLSTSALRQLIGDGLLLLASICWASYGLLSRRFQLAPAHSASFVAVLSACCFMPLYVMLPGKTLFLASWQELAVQGFFHGALFGAASIFIYSRAVASLGAVETAMFTAAVPCIITVAAFFLMDEMPTSIVLLCVAVVSVGMVFGMKRER